MVVPSKNRPLGGAARSVVKHVRCSFIIKFLENSI